MNSFETFNVYQSLKLHFTQENYDCFKYNFKTSARPSTYNMRRDKYHFEKLTKRMNGIRKEITSFMLSNFVEGYTYITDFNEEAHYSRLRRVQSLSYNFRYDLQELKKGGLPFNEMMRSDKKGSIIKALMAKEVSIESCLIMDSIAPFAQHIIDNHNDPLGINREYCMKILKYKSFMKLGKEKKKEFKQVALNILKEKDE